jgi:hypothetical protein
MIKMKQSDNNPKANILKISIKEKLDCVMGWQIRTILRIRLVTKKRSPKLTKGEDFLNKCIVGLLFTKIGKQRSCVGYWVEKLIKA